MSFYAGQLIDVIKWVENSDWQYGHLVNSAPGGAGWFPTAFTTYCSRTYAVIGADTSPRKAYSPYSANLRRNRHHATTFGHLLMQAEFSADLSIECPKCDQLTDATTAWQDPFARSWLCAHQCTAVECGERTGAISLYDRHVHLRGADRELELAVAVGTELPNSMLPRSTTRAAILARR